MAQAQADAQVAHEAAETEAHEILQLADKFFHDNQLTMLELCTFLPHTEFEGFLEWLLKNKYHAGGHWDYHEQFRAMDPNHTHTLDLEELTSAVRNLASNPRY